MRVLLVVVIAAAVAVAAYLFWPRKAGEWCNAFRGHYETHCLMQSEAPSICTGLRGTYDDSIRERANNESYCQDLSAIFSEYEERQRKAKERERWEELYKQLGEPVPANIRALYE